MTVHTRSQRLSQAAFAQVHGQYQKLTEKQFKEYFSFAKKFPALVHTCGLAQAVAFARAKKETDYVDDLAEVLKNAGHLEITDGGKLDECARNLPLNGYLRLSRNAIEAASWLKRYAEAVGEDDT